MCLARVAGTRVVFHAAGVPFKPLRKRRPTARLPLAQHLAQVAIERFFEVSRVPKAIDRSRPSILFLERRSFEKCVQQIELLAGLTNLRPQRV